MEKVKSGIKMEEYMKVDDYGLSTICNIYYDTPDYLLIRRSLDKPLYKEKFRLRSYGVPDEGSPAFMEIKKKYNGINYVIAREGDTYATIAFRINVRERDLREDNDALGRDLMPGERVYLAPKKTTGSKEFVWTHTGQSLWKLSQEEGVQIEAILKYNELDPKIRTFRTRQKIYLKKVKEPK